FTIIRQHCSIRRHERDERDERPTDRPTDRKTKTHSKDIIIIIIIAISLYPISLLSALIFFFICKRESRSETPITSSTHRSVHPRLTSCQLATSSNSINPLSGAWRG